MKNISFKTATLALTAALFFASNPSGISAYESPQTLKLKNEVASIESQLAAKRRELTDANTSIVENYTAAGAFEKAAAEAERKANVQKTMVFVKVGYDTAMTLSSPPTTIKDFLLGKLVDEVNSASWDIKFEYKLARPDELPASAGNAFAKAQLRAQEKVSWAKSDKASSQGKELDEGTNEYNYFMFKGFAEGLAEQGKNFRKLHGDAKAQRAKIVAEISKLETALEGRNALVGEQKKNDDLYAISKAETEKEKAAEETRQEAIRKQTRDTMKDGITDASVIDMSPELAEIKSVSDKLVNSKVSLETYETVISAAKNRAWNKKEPALKPPANLSEAEASKWRQSQQKILNEKYTQFIKQAEAIYDGVCAESLSRHEEARAMRKDLRAVFWDEAASKEKTRAFYEKLREGEPKLQYAYGDYTGIALAEGDYRGIEGYSAYLKKLLDELPKAKAEAEGFKKYFDSADAQYNDYQKSLARDYNNIAGKINEHVKKNFQILRHYNKKYSGESGEQYIPETDIPRYVSGGMDYALMIKRLDESEKVVKAAIASASDAEGDRKDISDRAEVIAARLSSAKEVFRGETAKVHSTKNTVKGLEDALTQLSADAKKYRSTLEAIEENYIALQLIVNYRVDKYARYPAIARQLNYKFGDNIKDIHKLIKGTEEKDDPWTYEAGSVLFRFRKLLEKSKEEENILKIGLRNYLARTEAIKSAMASVKPDELPTNPATAAYFIKGKRPTLDYDKIERELSQTLAKKGNFDYFSDRLRDFYCDGETENLRQKIAEAKGAIYKIAWDAGAAFEPASVETLYIDNREILANVRYDAVTIYRAERQSDSVEIRGTVDKPQNARDIEVSLDGGATYKKGALTLSGKNFQGTIDLIPNRTVEIRLKINSARGDDFAVYPRFGQGVEIFYSTEDPSRDVKEAIGELIASYESESPFAFMRGVSENFLGGYTTMERAIRADFARFDAISMKIYTDKITIAPSREQAVADVRWERSWFDTSANKIVGAQSGANTFRMEKTGGRWKLNSYSGTPVFGLAATSAMDSPTGIVVTSGGGGGVVADGGGEITPTALPVRTGQILTAHFNDGSVFSFVSGQSISLWTNPGAYHDMEYSIYNYTPSVITPVSPGQIYDFGVASLESVTTAPTLFASDNEPAVTGHTYAVKCANGNYAKFRITNRTDAAITFDWAYQPDGSRDIR